MVLIRLRAGRPARLRGAGVDDLEAIAALLAPLFQRGELEGPPPHPDELGPAVLSGAVAVADAFSRIAGVMLLRSTEVGIAVAEAFRRQGVGQGLLEFARARHRTLQARIHADNTASRALFRSAGFREQPAQGSSLRTAAWHAREPARFAPASDGSFREIHGSRPAGRLVQRGGDWLLCDPVGGEGYADALADLPRPAAILVTRAPQEGIRLAALATGCPVEAPDDLRERLLRFGVAADAGLRGNSAG